MRQLKMITLSFLIYLAFSSNAFAKDYCGFESTKAGRQLKVINYIVVADLYCQKYGYNQKYVDFGKSSIADRQQLQIAGEKEFQEKLKSSSCRAELGDIGGRGSSGALDKWMTSSGNSYSMQATNNLQEFCSQAITVIDQYMIGADLENRSEISNQMQIRTIEKVSQKSSPPSISKSFYDGGLYNKESSYPYQAYRNLIPDGYVPVMMFIPGVGSVPTNQLRPVNGAH